MTDATYFIILLCLMPDDFTLMLDDGCAQRVNNLNCCITVALNFVFVNMKCCLYFCIPLSVGSPCSFLSFLYVKSINLFSHLTVTLLILLSNQIYFAK